MYTDYRLTYIRLHDTTTHVVTCGILPGALSPTPETSLIVTVIVWEWVTVGTRSERDLLKWKLRALLSSIDDKIKGKISTPLIPCRSFMERRFVCIIYRLRDNLRSKSLKYKL